jgi:hypothetical protein
MKNEISKTANQRPLNKHGVVCSADMKQKLNKLGIFIKVIGSEVYVGLNGNACLCASADNFQDAFDAFQLKIQNAVNYKRSVESGGNNLPYS